MPATEPCGLASALVAAFARLPIRDGVILDLDNGGLALVGALVEAGFTHRAVSLEDLGATLAAAPLVGPERVVAVLVVDGAMMEDPERAFERLAALLGAHAPGVLLVTALESYTLLDRLAGGDGDGLHLRPTSAAVHSAARASGLALVAAADDVERQPEVGRNVGGFSELVSARTGAGWAGGHVRAWASGTAESNRTAGPFLSAIVRTQGNRMEHLREVLLCLAAQTDDDFDVVLVVHDPVPNAATAIDELLDEHAPSFRSRVAIRVCSGGGRGRPLNVGLAYASGRYVAFVDDDDLVTADWVEGFHRGATDAGHVGSIVRSATARQRIRQPGQGHLGPYEVVSGFDTPYSHTFSLSDHLIDNQSPICSLALPRLALDEWGIRFDEGISAHEDWDVLLRLAGAVGVVDTRLVTSIYHWWVDGTGSAGVVDDIGWSRSAATVRARFERSGLVAQPSQLGDLAGAARASELMAKELADANGKLATLAKVPGWEVATKLAKGAICARREVRRRVALRRDRRK